MVQNNMSITSDALLSGKNKNGKYSVEKLIYWSKYFTMYMPRNKAKHLRNVIPMGTNELEKEISFLESRGYTELTNHSGMKEAATLNDSSITPGVEIGQLPTARTVGIQLNAKF